MKTNSLPVRVVVAFLPALITVLNITSARASVVLTSYTYSWSKELEHTYTEYYDCVGVQVSVESMQSLNYSWNLLGGANSSGQYQSATTIEGLSCPTVEQNSSATEWQAWQGPGIAVVAGSKTTCDPNDEPAAPYQHTNTVGAFSGALRWEWRNTTEETASETIITSGSPRAGIAPVASNTNRESLWWIGVSATDLLTGQPIPSEQITIMGQTPDSQGSVFVMLNDGQWNDVTPGFGTLTSGQHHITAGVGAMRLPLELKTMELVWFDEGEAWDWAEVTINDATRTNWVGAQVWAWMELANESELDNAGYAVFKSHAWSVAQWPKTFGDYNPNAPSNQLSKPFTLTNSEINFFWLDKSPSETLAATMTVNIGSQSFSLSAETKFEVKRPESTLSAVIQVQPHIDHGRIGNTVRNWLILGDLTPETPPDNDNVPGLVGSAGFDGTLGSWAICQIGSTSRTIVLNTGYTNTASPSGLDGGFPYPFSSNPSADLLFFEDAPAQALNSMMIFASASDTYYDYLMYRPAIGSWVPIRMLTWAWDGEAVYSPEWGWGTVPGSCYAPQPEPSVETIEHPVWNAVLPIVQ
jgi:hypothetical protein